MKIAQITPVYEPVPPTKYGGIESVVSNLTEELIRRGHDVTLFASGDSKTAGRLEAICPRAVYRADDRESVYSYYFANLSHALKKSGDFDLVHDHTFHGLFFAPLVKVPFLTTLHNFTLIPREFLDFYPNIFVTTVGEGLYRRLKKCGVKHLFLVHNGIVTKDFPVGEGKGGYLAYLARIGFQKGTRNVIEVALASGEELRIAGKVDKFDEKQKEYFEKKVKPLIDGKKIKYLGELDHKKEVPRFLGEAKALVHAPNWEEPFGMTLIEAQACGTPIIAFAQEVTKKIVIHQKTGFLAKSLEEMVKMVAKIDKIDRIACREHVKRHFSVEKMTDHYEKVYQKVLSLWKE
jgi:glycosyltransferase involved in cell wall biosynthesis